MTSHHHSNGGRGHHHRQRQRHRSSARDPYADRYNDDNDDDYQHHRRSSSRQRHHHASSSSSSSMKRRHDGNDERRYYSRSPKRVRARNDDDHDGDTKQRRQPPPPAAAAAQQRKVTFEEGEVIETEDNDDDEEEYRRRVEAQLAAMGGGIDLDSSSEEDNNNNNNSDEKEAELERERQHRFALQEKLHHDAEEAAKARQQQQQQQQQQPDEEKKPTSPLPPPPPTTTAATATTTKDEEIEFDMFADSPSRIVEVDNTATAPTTTTATATTTGTAVDATDALDVFDDAEGYYVFRLGDVLNNRYTVFAKQGEGVFSTVLRVHDREEDNRELVVKVIRSQTAMYKTGIKELEYLKLLASHGHENSGGRRYIVRLHGHFEHRGHLCLLFEPLYKNLRQLVRKFGNVGLHISGVRHFAKQLLQALQHLKKCGILHADIKLDNIVVDESMTVAKLCDFGSAGTMDEREITPYLVSRFYRAPEIILGLEYDHKLDIWSLGCVLYELFTGKILFPGDDNNHMLLLHQELKGPFPQRMLKNGKFADRHFDMTDNMTFKRVLVDRHTRQEMVQKMKVLKSTRSLRQDILQHASTTDHTPAIQLADLLDKCFVLNPTKRIGVEAALAHPFITSAAVAATAAAATT